LSLDDPEGGPQAAAVAEKGDAEPRSFLEREAGIVIGLAGWVRSAIAPKSSEIIVRHWRFR
jgi:hypothetical protein